MGFKTWSEEFIPLMPVDMLWSQAIAHSRKKWDGLLPASLKRHGIRPKSRAHIKAKWVIGDGDTCALCYKAYGFDYDDCDMCPIVKCFAAKQCDREGSPWDIYVHTRNYRPMRKLLAEVAILWSKWIKAGLEAD